MALYTLTPQKGAYNLKCWLYQFNATRVYIKSNEILVHITSNGIFINSFKSFNIQVLEPKCHAVSRFYNYDISDGLFVVKPLFTVSDTPELFLDAVCCRVIPTHTMLGIQPGGEPSWKLVEVFILLGILNG